MGNNTIPRAMWLYNKPGRLHMYMSGIVSIVFGVVMLNAMTTSGMAPSWRGGRMLARMVCMRNDSCHKARLGPRQASCHEGWQP